MGDGSDVPKIIQVLLKPRSSTKAHSSENTSVYGLTYPLELAGPMNSSFVHWWSLDQIKVLLFKALLMKFGPVVPGGRKVVAFDGWTCFHAAALLGSPCVQC